MVRSISLNSFQVVPATTTTATTSYVEGEMFRSQPYPLPYLFKSLGYLGIVRSEVKEITPYSVSYPMYHISRYFPGHFGRLAL